MKPPRAVWSTLSIVVLVALFAALGIWVFGSGSGALGPTIVVTPEATRIPFIRTPPPITPPSILPTIVTSTVQLTGTAMPTRIPPPTIDANQLPSVTNGPLTGWRIYENRQFGLRIKFPPFFKISLGSGFPWKESLFHVILGDVTTYKTNPVGVPFSAGLTVLDNSKGLSVQDLFRANHSRIPQPNSTIRFWTGEENPNPTVIQLPTASAIRFTNYGYGGKGPTYLIPFPNNSTMIQFAYDEQYANDPTGKASQLFDLIASAIEFIP